MLLHNAGYSLQANRKTREEGAHPDRNAQFEYINAQVAALQGAATRHLGGHKKEGKGGRFQERRPGVAAQGEPEEVRVHDFLDKELGKAIPYGVYDLTTIRPG